MNTRRLGKTGLQVSALGIGCWGIGGPTTNLGLPTGWGPIDDDDALYGLHYAYEHGVTLFDVADVYGHGRAERTLADSWQRCPARPSCSPPRSRSAAR